MYDIDNGDITYGNESIYDIQLQIGVAKWICHAVKLYDDRNNSR